MAFDVDAFLDEPETPTGGFDVDSFLDEPVTAVEPLTEQEAEIEAYEAAGGGLMTSLERGGRRLKQSLAAAGASLGGMVVDEEGWFDTSPVGEWLRSQRDRDIAEVRFQDEMIRNLPAHPTMRRAIEAANEAGDLWPGIKAFSGEVVDSPNTLGFLADQAAELAPQALTMIVGAKGVNTLLPSFVTGMTRHTAVMGGAGFANSVAATYGPNVAEALEKGMDFDQAEARAALQSLAQGSVDALTAAVVPWRIGPNQWTNIPAQTLIQMVGGASGEALRSRVVGETAETGDLVAEGLLEAIGLPGDIAAAALTKDAQRPAITKPREPDEVAEEIQKSDSVDDALAKAKSIIDEPTLADFDYKEALAREGARAAAKAPDARSAEDQAIIDKAVAVLSEGREEMAAEVTPEVIVPEVAPKATPDIPAERAPEVTEPVKVEAMEAAREELLKEPTIANTQLADQLRAAIEKKRAEVAPEVAKEAPPVEPEMPIIKPAEEAITPTERLIEVAPEVTPERVEPIAERSLEGPREITELEQKAEELPTLERFKSWANGRFGRDKAREMQAEIESAWERVNPPIDVTKLKKDQEQALRDYAQKADTKEDYLSRAQSEYGEDVASGLVERVWSESEYVGVSRQDVKPSSWVIRNKENGEVIMETFDTAKVDALNTEKYEAIPIAEHLRSIGRDRLAEAISPERVAREEVAAPIERTPIEEAREKLAAKKAERKLATIDINYDLDGPQKGKANSKAVNDHVIELKGRIAELNQVLKCLKG